MGPELFLKFYQEKASPYLREKKYEIRQIPPQFVTFFLSQKSQGSIPEGLFKERNDSCFRFWIFSCHTPAPDITNIEFLILPAGVN